MPPMYMHEQVRTILAILNVGHMHTEIYITKYIVIEQSLLTIAS